MSNRTFTSFYLNDHLFGIDILQVREVNRQLEITPVQHAQDFVSGLVNLRGQIVTILDLNKRLGLGHSTLTNLTHNIILKTDGELAIVRANEEREDLKSVADVVGLLVDRIGDVVTIDEDEIDHPPANISNIDGKYFSGVVKLDKTLMAVLSLDKVLLEAS